MSDASDETKQDDGGPAFPGIEGQEGYGNCTMQAQASGGMACVTHNQGMSLRDWFAGQVLAGYATRPSYADDPYFVYADIAYAQADAMIRKRAGDAMLRKHMKDGP